MKRYEQSLFFEAICHLKATYAERPDIESRSAISIDDVMAYAQAIMFAVEAEEEATRALEEYAGQTGQQQSVIYGDPRN